MIKVFVKYQEIEKELEFPGGAEVKSLSATVGDTRNAGLIPGSRRSPGGGSGNPLQYSCWEIPWTEEPGGLQSGGGPKESDMTEHKGAVTLRVVLREVVIGLKLKGYLRL